MRDRGRNVLVVLLVLPLLMGLLHSIVFTAPPVETAPIDPRNPITVRIVSPLPVILVAPVAPDHDHDHDPSPVPPAPAPPPSPGPAVADTPLSRAGREYLRTIPTALPETWVAMAAMVDSGTISDKAGAVKLHAQLSADLNTALDQLFSVGTDARGKIVNRAAISGPLRASAAAMEGGR